MASQGSSERRKYIRIPFNSVLKCQKYRLEESREKDIVQAVVSNISAGGVLFETDLNYAVGEVLKMEIDVPGWEKFKSEFYKDSDTSVSNPVIVLASVVRVEIVKSDNLYDVGVCFAGIDEGHRWALIKYIEHIQAGQSDQD